MTQQSSYSPRNYNVVHNIVFIGTYVLLATLSILFLIGLSLGDKQVSGRLVACGASFLYIAGAQLVARRKHPHAAAYMLVAFYLVFAATAVWLRGVNSPVGIFTFGLATVLAGILLKAGCAFRAALLASLVLASTQLAATLGWHTAGASLAGTTSKLSNVFEYSAVFGLLALVAWFYNREMDQSSTHAREAEAALQMQKVTFNQQVKKRTSKLEHAQLEEIQQMYHFAELGQLGVTLLHDVANHLTALTLEIEGMQNQRHTKATDRARQIVAYLEATVDSTRDRLHGSTDRQSFNIISKTSEAVAFLAYKAERNKVVVDWQPPAHSWAYEGDPASFCQVVVIIISNAIDAYSDTRKKKLWAAEKRHIAITMEKTKTHILVHISDWGKGIPKKERKYLFKPFHSSKKTGLGIGLFMARQTVEINFHGTLTLSPLSDHTEFIITLPRKDQPAAKPPH